MKSILNPTNIAKVITVLILGTLCLLVLIDLIKNGTTL